MRETPAWRKLYLVSQLNQTVRLLAISGLRERYPGVPVVTYVNTSAAVKAESHV